MNSRACTLLERLSLGLHPQVPSIHSFNRETLLSRLRSDLSTLLNTSGLAGGQDLSASPYAATSVINYGIGNVAGQTRSGLAPHLLERRIRQAIFTYEPRIIRHSLQVSWVANGSEPMADMQFLIQGQLRCAMQVYPFTFRSLWNTQSGAVHIDTPDGVQHHG